MLYLLDTATAANNALIPEVLPDRVRKLIDTDDTKGCCGVSLLEMAILHRRGRLPLKSGTLQQFFEAMLAGDLELVDVTPEIAAATNELPAGFPWDPFDRAIAATARVLNLTLITPDSKIRDAQFCKVEFFPFKPARS